MMKAAAIGRLADVTKLLQTQRSDSRWRMQDSVNSGAFPLTTESPQRRRSGVLRPENFLKSAASQSPSRRVDESVE